MSSKHVGKVTLRKDGVPCILQGLVHWSTPDFYTKLQKEMDGYEQEGFQVFYEGVKKPVSQHPEWDEKRRSVHLFLEKFMFRIGAIMSADKSSVISDKVLRYSPKAVVADMTHEECVEELIHQNFSPPLFFVETVCLPWFRKVLQSKMSMEKMDWSTASPPDIPIPNIEITCDSQEFRGKIADEFSGMHPVAKLCFLALFYTDVVTEILRGVRNNVCVSAVVRHCVGGVRPMYVQYGNAHLSGIAHLLQMHGWNIEKTEEISYE